MLVRNGKSGRWWSGERESVEGVGVRHSVKKE